MRGRSLGGGVWGAGRGLARPPRWGAGTPSRVGVGGRASALPLFPRLQASEALMRRVYWGSEDGARPGGPRGRGGGAGQLACGACGGGAWRRARAPAAAPGRGRGLGRGAALRAGRTGGRSPRAARIAPIPLQSAGARRPAPAGCRARVDAAAIAADAAATLALLRSEGLLRGSLLTALQLAAARWAPEAAGANPLALSAEAIEGGVAPKLGPAQQHQLRNFLLQVGGASGGGGGPGSSTCFYEFRRLRRCLVQEAWNSAGGARAARRPCRTAACGGRAPWCWPHRAHAAPLPPALPEGPIGVGG
jgi:hypothetical protein